MSTMKTTRDVKGVGVAIPRPDGPEKVTGRVVSVPPSEPASMDANPSRRSTASPVTQVPCFADPLGAPERALT